VSPVFYFTATLGNVIREENRNRASLASTWRHGSSVSVYDTSLPAKGLMNVPDPTGYWASSEMFKKSECHS